MSSDNMSNFFRNVSTTEQTLSKRENTGATRDPGVVFGKENKKLDSGSPASVSHVPDLTCSTAPPCARAGNGQARSLQGELARVENINQRAKSCHSRCDF